MTLDILQLPELTVTEHRQTELAIDAAAMRYGQAAEIERQAWQMYYEGIDAGYTYEVTDDLFRRAQLAEALRVMAQCDLDAAKAVLIGEMQ